MSTPARGGAFFRSMVLMGGSLALGCGGMTQDDGSGGTSGNGGSGGGAGGGLNGTGGQPAGSGGQGTGGYSILLPPTGGSSTGGDSWGEGGFGGAYPTDCPTTQLNCPNDYYGCAYGAFDSYGLSVLPANCACDPSRPASSADCGPTQEFVCLGARESAQGEVFDPAVAYNCACVDSLTYTDCGGLCANHPEAHSNHTCYDPEDSPLDLDAYLCGCAVTVLK